mmetsp:Transcript_23837/g.68453  ORF Transcript_23837/g.68453 Transcript_23837/m.68453 type:complete len:415 (-) Transcript_23837:1586-2830(-)
MQVTVDHHLGNDRVSLRLVHIKHATELTEREGIVLRGVSEEVRSKAFELDLLDKHLADLLGSVLARDKTPHFKVRQKISCLLPIALFHGHGGTHDVVTRLLRRSSEDLTIVNIVVLAERARDDTVSPASDVTVDSSGSHIGKLEKHSADKVASLEEIQIDMLVEGDLSPLLRLLLLWGLVTEAASRDTLGQKLTVASGANIGQAVVRLPDLSKSESGHAEGNHHAVEQDLRLDIARHADGLLNVRHEQKVAGLVETIVIGVVEYMAKHGPGLGPVGSILVDIRAEVKHEFLVVDVLNGINRWLAASSRRVRLGVVGTGRDISGNAGRVEHAGLSELVVEGSGAGNLLGDSVVLVVDVLDAELSKLGGLRLGVEANKVGLILGKKINKFGLIPQTDDIFGSMRRNALQGLVVLFI